MSRKGDMPKATGSMEGFYRSLVPHPQRPLPPRQQLAPAPVSAPVPAAIIRQSTSTEMNAAKGETPGEQPPNPKTKSTDRNSPVPTMRSPGDGPPVVARQRSSIILESAFSSKAAKTTALTFDDWKPQLLPDSADPSMVCTVAYRGMEVIFATARNADTVVYGLCARTRVVLQTLDLPAHSQLVSLLSNPVNGMVAIALSDGTVHIYHPLPTTSKLSSDPATVVSAFGKFRWVNGPLISCRETFYGQGEKRENVFRQKRLANGSGEPVDVSTSSDYKVLVSHRDQLAVFDASPIDFESDEVKTMLSVGESVQAELLWTARLERYIESAKLSGDGRAIAIVVEGEGLENVNPFGVRTFERDSQDGSTLRSEILEPKDVPKPASLQRSASSSRSVGIVYKPGPFLVHNTSVSTVSFRGFGHNNSDMYPDYTDGNDLLMTYCRNGSSIRIFSQNSWKKLTEWSAPPNARADWVRGLSAFNLGDLEPTKRRKKAGSAPPSRCSSYNSLADASAGINKDLLGKRPPTYQGPNTAAGAWIAEVTFRNDFPALRLSRLSYMKRGGDEMQPAHFESVAAILPSSSLSAESVLAMGDSGLSVQGIWPAWNPWHSEASIEKTEGSLRGSAMTFLGLSSTSPSPAGFFGENYQAGTHSPPSELRVVASHPTTGKVVLMEFPLWGDEAFGAMELGSPLRYELSLSDVDGAIITPEIKMSQERSATPTVVEEDETPAQVVSLVFQCSIICGRIDAKGKSISLVWRKEGSMSVLPASLGSARHDSLVSISSSSSVDSLRSHSFYVPNPDSDEMEVFKDVSVLPAPLSLPSLRLPDNESTTGKVLVAVKWWTDFAYVGPPQLLAVTSEGTILVYELSPPWSVLEPSMPSDDLFVTSSASVHSQNDSFDDSDEESSTDGDYEVVLTPDPDFGIGLRLEAQIDGMPAIAGSYKKHPLTGGTLPAENTGMIVLGDELVSINGISLEGSSFDDIISTVRRVGTDAPKGAPICMKFRPAMENRRRMYTAQSAFSLSASQHSEGSRRTMEQILGVHLDQETKEKSFGKIDAGLIRPTSFSNLSKVTTDVGSQDLDGQTRSESTQEFSRIVAVVQEALPNSGTVNVTKYQSCLSLLPWYSNRDAPPIADGGREGLLIVAEGSRLHAKRLALVPGDDVCQAVCTDLGSTDFTNDSYGGGRIRMIEKVPTDTESWCIAVHHEDGTVRLTFIEKFEPIAIGDHRCASDLSVNFSDFVVVHVDGPCSSNKFMFRASSVELFATLSSVDGQAGVVSVWSSRPYPACLEEQEKKSQGSVSGEATQEYVRSSLVTNALDGNVLDIRFVSACLGGFPLIVTMTQDAATVHRRDGGSLNWKPVVLLKYGSIPRSEHFHSDPTAQFLNGKRFYETTSPALAIPHLIPTLRSLVSVCDERHYLRSDWHPDAILAYACTAAQGTRSSLRGIVKGIYLWLSHWLDSNEDETPVLDPNFPLVVAPIRDLGGHLLASDEAKEDEEPDEGAATPMWSLAPSSFEVLNPKNEKEQSLVALQHVLCPSRRTPASRGRNDESVQKAEDANDSLPEPLAKLNADETWLLWAIGEMLLNPPRFKGLDPQGQLTLFAVSLMRNLDRAMNEVEDEKANDDKPVVQLGLNRAQMPARSFLVKQPSSTIKPDKNEFVPIASAGCLSAMTSSSQVCLLEACRVMNEKFDWKSVRSLRLPFWIRSDSKLRAICEEVGQRRFKETRDIMDCALFFIVTGNMRALRNFAAADQSTNGKTFLKFITEQDFSSPRGRKAAEKNAYSLLRKKKYIRAASFFLLAQPPMLNSALETIVMQMEDLDLAFLVARMIGSNTQRPGGGSNGGFGVPGLTIGGMMGMGGGYAAGGPEPTPSSVDEVPFSDWEPSLSKGAKNLITDRGLPMAKHDPCLKALQLVWLGRREEASLCLSGLSQHSCADDSVLASDALFPRSFDLRLNTSPPKDDGRHRALSFPTSNSPSTESVNDRVLKKANSVINFVSCPFLVMSMNASVRSRWASTLLVSRALMRRGIDLVSTRIILQNTNELDVEEHASEVQIMTAASSTADASHKAHPPAPSASLQSGANSTPSSMFDSFDTPVLKKSQQPDVASSIFDSFDTVPQKPKQTANNVTSFSIFDEFETAPPKKLTQATPQTQAASSIFDSFDTAPPRKPSQATPQTQAASSIFDSFHTAPPKKPEQATPQTQAASSIFDSFDAVPPKKQDVQEAQAAPSIFDSFDPPPSARRKATAPASSIFESCETPGSSKKLSSVSSVGPSQEASTSIGRAQISSSDDDVEDITLDVESLPTPKIWVEWRRHMLVQSAARRLLREIASIMSCFCSDSLDTPMKLFRRHVYPFLPSGAGEVLHQHCEGAELIASMICSLEDVCALCGMNESVVVNQALRILSCPSRQGRVVYAALLHTLVDRIDKAEEVIRDASTEQIQHCESIACSNDHLVENRKTAHYLASQYLRRLSSKVSWQLEICLWLNRGGAIPLSADTVKEATIAVRTGLLVASWGRSHACLEAMVHNEPDCPMDQEAGAQLWSSMKLITGPEARRRNGAVGTGSGGWEFLVDCRRSEATEMLRNTSPGTFIIRPHPEDTGVFTLSFKTNLVPTEESQGGGKGEGDTNAQKVSEAPGTESAPSKSVSAKPVKKDDVVQHAIIRLSDAGFRCGSFGPFATLLQLLEAVSGSLPFELLFNKPPSQGIIKDEGTQPSPNAVFLRKLALILYANDLDRRNSVEALDPVMEKDSQGENRGPDIESSSSDVNGQKDEKAKAEFSRRKAFGMYLQLTILSEIRKQLCAVAAAECDEENGPAAEANNSLGGLSDGTEPRGVEGPLGVEEAYAVASRLVRPFLKWCRLMETSIVYEVAPSINEVAQSSAALPVELAASETAIELAPQDVGCSIDGGDAVIRRMIQPDSGVEFRTLRVGEGSESAMIVLFSKNAAMKWLVSSGAEKNSDEALARLERMEKRRVIEPIAMKDLAVKTFATNATENDAQDRVRYRFVDPWEVESLESREAETKAASLGRGHYYEFSVGIVAESCESIFRKMGGPSLLGIWTYLKGGLRLTKAIASVYAPWERDTGGDLQMTDGVVSEPSSFQNSIREHLYRNALFRLLELPQRFLALVQVELLDLKNLTAPGGSSSLSVFALVRLKRPGSSARLTNKAKTLDTATTLPTKIGKSTGPNAAASCGSVVRFRFPLPEDVHCDGVSADADREALFKGPPTVLQVSVYEKKFMSDIFLGSADIDLDALTGGGQLEEWVPLRATKQGINWFTRLRLTLRFELMCLDSNHSSDLEGELPPSVGLTKIKQLSEKGGAVEDTKVKKSASTSDLLSYFESMVS